MLASSLFRRSAAALLGLAALGGSTSLSLAAGTSTQSFLAQAEPSSQEQYLLELINRARANPAGEGAMLAGIQDPEILRYYAYYAVDTNRLRSDFASYAVQPPLALSPALMSSARTQAIDQAEHGFQGHSGTNGSTLRDRLVAVNYPFRMAGENTFTYVSNPFFGHVGLNADWGVPELDHRENLMNYEAGGPVYREVGISCVPTAIKNFGPLVVTQDFGQPLDEKLAFVTGVIYQDRNNNGTYDEGEGLGGVSVTPEAGAFFTRTSASGGFCLPLPADQSGGSLGVVASGGGLGAPRRKSVAFVAGRNVKLDFTGNDAVDSSVAQVTVAALSKVASSDGSRVGVVTVSRAGGSLSKELTVSLRIGGTAKAGVDYHALPATVTIPAGQDSASLQVQGAGQVFAGVKKVKLRLDSGSGYLPGGRTTAKVKILGQD